MSMTKAQQMAHRAIFLALTLTATLLLPPSSRAENPVERGRYLATIMDCGGCHTPGALVGKPDMAHLLSGSDVGFEVPELGVFYPPNLTPDRETGVGDWSEEELIAAFRTGARPDGRVLAPVMPWHSYAALTDDDSQALAAFLKTLPPVSHKTPGPFGPSEKATAPYLAVTMPK